VSEQPTWRSPPWQTLPQNLLHDRLDLLHPIQDRDQSVMTVDRVPRQRLRQQRMSVNEVTKGMQRRRRVADPRTHHGGEINSGQIRGSPPDTQPPAWLTHEAIPRRTGHARTSGNDAILDALLLRLHIETDCRRGGALALRRTDLEPDCGLVRLREKGETLRW
jgi:hypothetical protein